MDNLMERKKEVIDLCLEVFIKKGLAGTSTRDLSSAMRLQSGALYYYFESKDEAVIACAEEAVIRLENNLIVTALREANDPKKMLLSLKKRANKMAPTMRFLAQVCSTPKYNTEMRSVLSRLNERYKHYAKKFAERLGCDIDDVEPYLYICIASISNYMIFGEEFLIVPQMNLMLEHLNGIIQASVSLTYLKEEQEGII